MCAIAAYSWPVELLHAASSLDVRHRSVRLADRVNRERRVEHARDPVGQRLDAPGVEILVEQHASECANRCEAERAPLLAHERSRRCPRPLLRVRPVVFAAPMHRSMPARGPHGKNNMHCAFKWPRTKDYPIVQI